MHSTYILGHKSVLFPALTGVLSCLIISISELIVIF